MSKGPHYGQKVSNERSGKHYHVDTSYLTKKFVQSGETSDSQALRAQVLKLEQQLIRERFAKEQLLGGADASTVLSAGVNSEELAAAQAKNESLTKEVERLNAAKAELAAELEWVNSACFCCASFHICFFYVHIILFMIFDFLL